MSMYDFEINEGNPILDITPVEWFALLKDLFWEANENMLRRDAQEMLNNVSERMICADLKTEMEFLIRGRPEFCGYYVDVEYNRGAKGTLKAIVDPDDPRRCMPITCDLIIHSRGGLHLDNLLCLEMKKSYRRDKQKDKDCLIALTTPCGIMSVSGNVGNKTIVGDYLLGIYYEYDKNTKTILIEFYKEGGLLSTVEMPMGAARLSGARPI